MNDLAIDSVAQLSNTYCPHVTPAVGIEPVSYLEGRNWGGRLLAALCLIPGLPLMAVLMVLVKLTSRGPALYSQVRVGKHGKIFVMKKIRSMVQNAESNTGPTWAREKDPRVTAFGKFLRASHLDELPQLISVVKGDMAIFGPRPERPEMIPILSEQIPGYLDRLAVLPGITGLAQINLPPDVTINCVRKKLQLDREYVREANFMLDFRMFCWTLLRLIMVPSGVATRLMGLRRVVILDTTDSAAIVLSEAATSPSTAEGSFDQLREYSQDDDASTAVMVGDELTDELSDSHLHDDALLNGEDSKDSSDDELEPAGVSGDADADSGSTEHMSRADHDHELASLAFVGNNREFAAGRKRKSPR